jgi:hypothetical protein
MRTTVTLDPDVELLIKRAMKERGLTFKQAINAAIRAGAASSARGSEQAQFQSFDMGEPLVDVTKALRLAADLEDEERARRLAQGR